MQPMRAKMTLKSMHPVTADFCISKGFHNPNCDCYDIRYLPVITGEASC